MPTSPLAGTVAVVAGGARGIGRACALRLAERGARVAVLDVDLAAGALYGEELSADSVELELERLSGEAMGIQVDLTDAAATDRAVEAVVARWSRLDFAVLPVGGAVTPFERSAPSKSTDEDFTTLVEVNMHTVVNTCRAVVAPMRAAGRGSIVTVASTSALWVTPGGQLAVYGMTKAGVVHYTRHLAAEVAPDGIRVNCIAPGIIRSSRQVAQATAKAVMGDQNGVTIPLRREGEPDDIADVVEFLVGPQSSYVTGQVIAVDGGLTL